MPAINAEKCSVFWVSAGGYLGKNKKSATRIGDRLTEAQLKLLAAVEKMTDDHISAVPLVEQLLNQ